MGFMSSYKHLDNLCRNINGKGISGYIEDMENHRTAAFRVGSWEDDYKKLKHYRWVRNQIAHENNADEDTMCEDGNVDWLEDFYARIMDQTDPLALARKTATPSANGSIRRQPVYQPPVSSYHYDAEHLAPRKNRHVGIWIAAIVIVTIIIAVIFFKVA